jgi:hypothetical protein
MYLVGFARLRAAFTGRNCFELQLFLRHVLFVSRVFYDYFAEEIFD